MTGGQAAQIGAQGVQGALFEHGRIQAEQDASLRTDRELRRTGAQTASNIQSERLSELRTRFDNMFGLRPEDDPYMDFYEDLESEQGGLI